MKKHISNYFKFFKIGEQDYIPSEISGKPANDLHHIEHGRYKRDDSVENIIALTREEHNQAHGITQPKLTKEYLKEVHNNYLKKYEQV